MGGGAMNLERTIMETFAGIFLALAVVCLIAAAYGHTHQLLMAFISLSMHFILKSEL